MADNLPVAFPEDRGFQMWFYDASHSQLLLRSSSRGNPRKKRLEVYFKAVDRICIPTSMASLSIALGDPGDLADPPPAELLTLGRKLYVLRGKGFIGYVVAGYVGWTEDDLSYNDPSSLLDVGIASSELAGLSRRRPTPRPPRHDPAP